MDLISGCMRHTLLRVPTQPSSDCVDESPTLLHFYRSDRWSWCFEGISGDTIPRSLTTVSGMPE